MLVRTVSALLLLCAVASPVHAQPVDPWLDDLAFPTNMAFAPDGRLFFTEKGGQLRVVDASGGLDPEPFASFDVETSGESGLLGIALHPAFDEGEPWIYLYRSEPTTQMNQVLRIRADGARGEDPEILLETVSSDRAYHNGGDLLFGRDGLLYVSVGEAHDPERAQDPTDLGGKVLRLTPEGAAAPGNPFGEGSPVFTMGHRNSFGLCMDPSTGTIWETENGPDRDDEVNRLEAGANHGWPIVTGRDGDGQFVDPVAVFRRTIAITGCAWVDGELYVGSFNDGAVRIVDPSSGDVRPFGRFDAGVTDLQAGPDGALYVATSDAIWRLGRSSDPTAEPTMDPPPLPPEPGQGRAWIALIAAGVLALGLGWRILAGRRLRRATPSDA